MTILLFLDTETNSLVPKRGQIIEIGGAIIEIDPVTFYPTCLKHFESLVRLETPFEDKIERLTGITRPELEEATIIKHVQEQWVQFLEPFEDRIEGIVGHSISFDLAFLKAEKWFIPPVPIIDTLDLSKLLFSDMSAVNLEFLTTQLQLEHDYKILLSTKHNSAHRALYDSLVDAALFSALLHRTTTLNLPKWITQSILTHFIPIESLVLYPSNQKLLVSSKETEQVIDQEINWQKKEKYSICAQKIEQLNQEESELVLNKLELLVSEYPLLPRHFIIVLVALSISFYIHVHFNKKLHYSFFSDEVFLFFNLVTEHVFSDITKPIKYSVDTLETLILALPNLPKQVLSFKQLTTQLEVLGSLLESESRLNAMILDITNQIDFLSFYIAKLDPMGVFNYSFHKKNHSSEQIFSKIREIIQLTNELTNLLPVEHSLVGGLQKEIQKNISLLISESLDYELCSRSGETSIAQINTHFILYKYVDNLLKSHSIHSIDTYLTREEVEALSTLIGIDPTMISVNYLNCTRESSKETYNSLLEVLESTKPRTLVLFTQGKTFKELTDRLLPTLTSDNFLIYGETGSLTKIKSKIQSGFNKTTVLRLNDYRYFLKDGSLKYFEHVLILDLPYVQVSQQLFDQNPGQETQVISTLRRLLLHSHVRTLLMANETMNVTTLTKQF
jgi:DNA polymerase III epsilon subunit-like protein